MGGMMKLINKIEQKGKYEEKIQTAIEMLKDGVEPAFVQKYTKLSLEKIKELKKEL